MGGAEAHLPRRVSPAPPWRERRVCPFAFFSGFWRPRIRYHHFVKFSVDSVDVCAVGGRVDVCNLGFELFLKGAFGDATLFRDDVSNRTLLPTLSKGTFRFGHSR